MDTEVEKLLSAIETQLRKGGAELGNLTALRKTLYNKASTANFPRKGDKIYAKYFKHQFFPATIDSFDPQSHTFHITWDDGDTEGRVVSVTDVALDRVPESNTIGVGSNVLFAQGYYGKKGDKFSGYRWHMGKVTNIVKQKDGTSLYDGVHAYGEGDGKWVTYKDYDFNFSKLKLDQFRVSPNALDAFGVTDVATPSKANLPAVDIFVCYSDENTKNNSDSVNPIKIIQELESSLKVKTNLKVRNPTLGDVAIMIGSAKVFIAFISNEFANDEKCQQQFQYAKKSKGIPVIPVVVGHGFDWTRTVVGLLIAGELYIHFKDDLVFKQKLEDLKMSAQKCLSEATHEGPTEIANEPTKPCDGFISYCWSNSLMCKKANEVSLVKGNELADPRRIKHDLESRLEGRKLWLDVEQLGTANQNEGNASMFEQIAHGLADSKVIISFISSEYSQSANCNMEFNHAVKTMGKPTIPIIVGERMSDEWTRTQVGMVLGEIEARGANSARIDLRDVKSEQEYRDKVELICSRVAQIVREEEEKGAAGANKKSNVQQKWEEAARKNSKAPTIGDHVISHWKGGQFFFSTIVSFDRDSMCFTVDWDDGDTTGRVVKYNEVAKNVSVSSASEVGVGTRVLFPQGQYRLTTADNKATDKSTISGYRYFEGEVTDIKTEKGGKTLFSGHHSRYDKSSVPRFKDVKYEFHDYELSQLRLAPNAFEVLGM